MKKLMLSFAALLAGLNSQADIVCSSSGKINKEGIISVYVSAQKKTANFAILREDTMQLTADYGWYYLGDHKDIQISGNKVVGKYMDLEISSTPSTAKACQLKRGCKEALLTAKTAIKVAKIEKLKVYCSPPSKVKPSNPDDF